jgi:phosphopantothenoylcysteine decarboxylase/phosphopantothenate--cysteine ligase
MTPAAKHFVGAASFEGIVGAPVLSDEFELDPTRGVFPGSPPPDHDPIGHLAIVEAADVYLIAPASANTIAKLAAGISDSMVTTAFLASAGPRAVAPSMNDRMYKDAATQSNLSVLRERGVLVIEPDTGPLASRREFGAGRLPAPERLLSAVEGLIPTPGPWDGLRVLVTAGGTREPIDSVRYVGNRSSGRMGLALVEAARRRGAEVTLIAANVALSEPYGVRRIDVSSAAELSRASHAALADHDVVLMAAAVSDFRPAEAALGKLSRERSGSLVLELEPTEDVLAALAGARNSRQLLVGFAAEHGGDALESARHKLQRKGVDAIVVNDVSVPGIGFDSTDNEVVVVTPDSEHRIERASKSSVAEAICARLDPLLRGLDSAHGASRTL